MKKLFNLFAALAILPLLSVTAAADQVFVANLTGAQEVPVVPSSGKGVCIVTLNAAQTAINVSLTYSGLTSNANMGHIHGPAPVGSAAGVQIGFAGIAGTSATVNITNQPITPAQVQQIRSGLAYVNIHTINFSGGEIRGQLKSADKFGDFDGDGRFDIGVYRPTNNNFYILNSLDNSLTALQWGLSSERLELGDYDGDGRTDFTEVRDVAGSFNWYILQSSNNTLRAVQWGIAGMNNDNTLEGDYDGDGKADIGVWRSSTGTFYILQSSNGALLAGQWGSMDDRRVTGDFDGDGKSDFAVLRTVGNDYHWYISQSSNGAFLAVQWGVAGDTAFRDARFDFDLDGKSDIAVWRPSDRTFYVRQSSNGALLAMQWGQTGDGTFIVDTDGDGKGDFVAVRDVGGSLVWYIWQSSSNTLRAVQWGITGDRPA